MNWRHHNEDNVIERTTTFLHRNFNKLTAPIPFFSSAESPHRDFLTEPTLLLIPSIDWVSNNSFPFLGQEKK